MEDTKNLATQGTTGMVTQNETHGFEDSRNEDLIIPRIKVINALSPERQDGDAEEGDVINSLTLEKINDPDSSFIFIPIKQYYNNIKWNPDRDAELRMLCRSIDGRIGNNEDGVRICEDCGCDKFDNTKTGKDAQPTCTTYINFLGFFSGNPMPVVLSFAKTNYNEGRKLLSMARSMRCNIWNYGYKISSRLMTKNKNKWYNMVVEMAGPTSEDDRALAYEIFKSYANAAVTTNYENEGTYATETDAEVAAEI